MKHRSIFGIYGKVFSYTLLILLAVGIIAAAFFFNQISSVLKNMERQQLSNVFAPLMEQLDGKSNEGVISISEDFHAKNAAFDFYVQNEYGQIIYKTSGAVPADTSNTPGKSDENAYYFGDGENDKFQMSTPLANGVKVYMSGAASGGTVYQEFIQKTIIVLLLLFVIGGLAASAFAYRITRPIKTLARDTKRMSELEFVPPPVARKDEIGQLADDVYKMYEELKMKIEREREMEESQRYFFSAASHELKTPITAASTILESMIEKWVEPSEYPQHLNDCLKMMKLQGKIISEILEIVHLEDEKLQLNIQPENLENMIKSVLPPCQMLAEAKEQTITLEIPEALMCRVDRHIFNRVLSNIIMNAVQNAPEQGEIRIWTENSLKEMNTDEQTFHLCIMNTNTNIDNETLKNAFEAFYRADKVRNKKSGHSGLGLTIVKKALDIMEIPFALENKKDGVLFWMRVRID